MCECVGVCYNYVHVRVCVCVCERERERGGRRGEVGGESKQARGGKERIHFFNVYVHVQLT